jgi:F0F1-type ATP synthase membrane subunit b/b'
MDATFHALGEILLKAVPTFLLVIFLNFYLKAVFYKPLERVRLRRYEATEGARKRAQESIERAEKKTADYERSLREAQAAVYQAHEKLHRELQDKQSAELHSARQQADAGVQQAKADLTRDIEAAKSGLARESESLANQIVESILRRSAA